MSFSVSFDENEARRLAFVYGRRLTCKRCKQPPGKPCRTKSGNKAQRDHAERYYPGWSKASEADWKELGT